MKKQGFKKMKRGLGNFGTLETFQYPDYRGAIRKRGRPRNRKLI